MDQQGNKVQASETSRRGLGLSISSTDDALDPKLVEAFEKLTEWQRELGRCLQSSRSQRDLAPYSDAELLVRIHDWTQPLFIVPEWGLRFAFNRAIAARVQGKFNFEAGEVAKAWREAAESTREALFRSYATGRTLPSVRCDWCDGKGHVYVNESGDRVKWEQRQLGIAMKKCDHREIAG